MIERLLAAESAFTRDEVGLAERLYAQVTEADPRNAIAVVGLARIAQRAGRRDEAVALAERALAIDPDEAAAGRLLRELLLEAVAPPAESMPTLPPEEPEPTSIYAELRWPDPDAPISLRRPSLFDRLRRWLATLGRSA